MRRPAGSRVPAEGQVWDSVNCYSIEFFNDEGERYLLETICDSRYQVRRWNGDRFAEEMIPGPEDFGNYYFEARRFYRGHTFIYKNAFSLLWSELTLRPNRIRLSEKFAQEAYNLKIPSRKDKIQILRTLIEHKIERESNNVFNTSYNDSGLSHIAVAQLIYGSRLFGHPSCDRVLAETRFLLDALEAAGDVDVRQSSYVVNGRAFNTVEKFEIDERRHRDQFYTNFVLAMLTAGLVIVGIFQVFMG